MSNDDACRHYTCVGCGLETCPDERPSPGEAEGLCDDCWDVEVTEGKLRGRDYEAWANL